MAKKKHGPATQMGLRQAEINKKNLQGKAPEVAPMIDLGGDYVDIGFNANEIEDPMLMRHLKGVPKQPSVQDIIEEIEDNFQYIELLANATPYGMMVPYALTSPPVDWVFCNGQVCPESPLRDLLIEQGNPFGESGGLPTVPNLSGRTVVGNTGMGNVQQPALDQTATALNKTLGTTSGLFTIKSDVAPQREFNIGTTDNGGLLSITIDNSYTGLSITDPDQANLTVDGADADITINNGKADLVDNDKATPQAGETKNATTYSKADLANAASGGTANRTTTGKAALRNHPDTTQGTDNRTTTTGNHSHTGSDGVGTSSSGHTHRHYPPRLGTVGKDNNVNMSEIARTHPPKNLGQTPEPDHGWGVRLNRYYYDPENVYRYPTSHGGTVTGPNQLADDATHSHRFTTNTLGNHYHVMYDTGHYHVMYDRNHRHQIWDRNHAHGITQNNHAHGITQQDHTHGITDVEHNHVAHATGTIPGSDFEFDLTQPGLVVNFIIFHGQHLPEDTEPVVRQDEFAPVAEEVKELKELVASLEARLK